MTCQVSWLYSVAAAVAIVKNMMCVRWTWEGRDAMYFTRRI